jgi:VanZ family protein
MLLIWLASSLPGVVKFQYVPLQDKGVHFIEYGILAALLAHAMRGTWPEWRMRYVFVVAWAVAVLWGLLDEIHQAFVPGRVADARDLLADAIGALVGAGLYLATRERRRSRLS